MMADIGRKGPGNLGSGGGQVQTGSPQTGKSVQVKERYDVMSAMLLATLVHTQLRLAAQQSADSSQVSCSAFHMLFTPLLVGGQL